ncbi:sucrase ferredoxin [Streptomyces hoynatensis]|uniref:Sucrase ferredoxin n=1 Tax=Streptomyces hoynatensis TaxID=1141874 RepID=A0A3A9YRG8_9ACTN|nr:sucrase ferredoxin [Streptomyces hoynatensis]RKN37866.1 sucrase ferredoxin [Streptomyces hoynatensis]
MNSTCAASSLATAEPLAGTAATATTWLLVEQPGPWGAKALTESRLAPETGAALEAAAAGTGVRPALIRRPARRRLPAGEAPRHRVYAAHTAPGNAWVRAAEVADPRELLGLDLARLGAGHHEGFGRAVAEPLVLVCANGRRDRCCALLGRPLAAELAEAGGAEVWETTHLGGHRFAPTLLVLPHGYAYGRMTAAALKGVLDALREGRVAPEGCRGRSCWERPGQAAELAVRDMTGEEAVDALRVTATEPAEGAGGGWEVTVAHADGRAWRAAVAEHPAAVATPASCGAEPRRQPRLTVTGIVPLRCRSGSGPASPPNSR